MVMDPTKIADRSVVAIPKQPSFGTVLDYMGAAGFGDLTVNYIGSAGDQFPKWGSSPATRDALMRDFWPTEPIFAGALLTTIDKYVAFGWGLFGPPKTVSAAQSMLQGIEFGAGWNNWLTKMLTDYFTQDNGAYCELIRQDYTSPSSPVISLKHLDAGRCIRTGRPDTPIYYQDDQGKRHLLTYYQCFELVDMPSPITRMRGMQVCALSRVLGAAQLIKDIMTYKREKISGRFTGAIHLVGGVQQKTLQTILDQHKANMSNSGMTRYVIPAIVAALNPEAQVSHELLELSSLPEGFDSEHELRWYMNFIALALAGDYQEYAPLPGHNLGTAQQSQVLDTKGKSKGPARFMSDLEHIFNFNGVLPRTVTFKYAQQSLEQDAALQTVVTNRGADRAQRVLSGEITPEIAARLAVDVGDLKKEYYDVMYPGTWDRTGAAVQLDDSSTQMV